MDGDWVFTCDSRSRCGAVFDPVLATSLAEVRRMAREAGWREWIAAALWYCPEHREEVFPGGLPQLLDDAACESWCPRRAHRGVCLCRSRVTDIDDGLFWVQRMLRLRKQWRRRIDDVPTRGLL